jgi:6-phosphofructokinase 2
MNPAIDVATSSETVVHTRKIRCTGVQRNPGGGGINVARVVTRLRAGCRALYPAGGPLGVLFQRLLAQEGVDSACIDIAGDTRESFTVHESSTGMEYRFVLPGPQLSKQEWQAVLHAIADFDTPVDYVVASGSLPPGVPDDFYARVADVVRAKGARFVLDTSGTPLALALEAGAYMVKPNLRELRELTGKELEGETSWKEAVRELVDNGKAEVVALSLGRDGALLATVDKAWRAPALPIKVASAVGAGDSFVGAMVWALTQDHTIQNAFRFGVAAGSAALLTPGTELCKRDDVERFYGRVRIEPI